MKPVISLIEEIQLAKHQRVRVYNKKWQKYPNTKFNFQPLYTMYDAKSSLTFFSDTLLPLFAFASINSVVPVKGVVLTIEGGMTKEMEMAHMFANKL